MCFCFCCQEKLRKGKSSTLNVEGVVDDKVAVPHHRKVNREVTDVTALVVVLQQGNRDVRSVRDFPFRLDIG